MIREFDLTGRLAVVTGGAAGIGRAISAVLAEAGARVVVADRNAEAAQALAAELGGIALALDVTDPEGCEIAAVELMAQHGPAAILVNNAGIVMNAPSRGPRDHPGTHQERLAHLLDGGG
ncbi:MAG: SDR family NAD(P)-dependent oxidoreductase, partial [Cypionkella sp.]